MTRNFFAIIHKHSYILPIVMESQSEGHFLALCKSVPTDWGHLFDKNTGELICSYSVEDVSWRNN